MSQELVISEKLSDRQFKLMSKEYANDLTILFEFMQEEINDIVDEGIISEKPIDSIIEEIERIF